MNDLDVLYNDRVIDREGAVPNELVLCRRWGQLDANIGDSEFAHSPSPTPYDARVCVTRTIDPGGISG